MIFGPDQFWAADVLGCNEPSSTADFTFSFFREDREDEGPAPLCQAYVHDLLW